jgi:phosphoribosyl 1,2-cyclic phosphodiesterase
MKTLIRATAFALLFVAAAPAFASSRLTPQQCNDYPFTKLTRPVTHKQLVNELSELESVVYDPAAGDIYYPTDLQDAEQRLQAKYQQDCVQPQHMANQQASAN